MKFTLPREAFQAGLQLVTPAVAARDLVPALTSVLIDASAAGVRLYGTDLDLAISTTVPASVESEGRVLLPAKRLLGIAKELPEGTVELSLEKASGTVALKCGRSRFTLKGLPASDFPTLPSVKFSSPWTLTGEALGEMVKMVAYAVSHAESRPALTGIWWDPEGGRLVATDGHRLSLVKHALLKSEGKVSKRGVIIPPRALRLIGSAFAPDAEVQVSASESHIGLRSGSTQVVTRLIDNEFPVIDNILPTNQPFTATTDRESLLAAVRRMLHVADDRSDCVVFSLSRRACRIAVQTPDIGRGQETVTMNYEGDPLVIGFNGRYILDALSAVPTDEVAFTFESGTRPCTIRPVDWKSKSKPMSLIVPLKVPAYHTPEAA